jgi:hypothetical protein
MKKVCSILRFRIAHTSSCDELRSCHVTRRCEWELNLQGPVHREAIQIHKEFESSPKLKLQALLHH